METASPLNAVPSSNVDVVAPFWEAERVAVLMAAFSSFSDNPCKVVRIPSVPSIHLVVALIVSNWLRVNLPLVITNF